MTQVPFIPVSLAMSTIQIEKALEFCVLFQELMRAASALETLLASPSPQLHLVDSASENLEPAD